MKGGRCILIVKAVSDGAYYKIEPDGLYAMMVTETSGYWLARIDYEDGRESELILVRGF
jgi:hypothetical protein